MPRVEEFIWDDTNEAKVLARAISPDAIDEILTSRFAVFRNRRNMTGAYQVVGRDLQGRYLTVIIEGSSADNTIWRPVTAWPSKQSEVTKAQQQGV